MCMLYFFLQFILYIKREYTSWGRRRRRRRERKRSRCPAECRALYRSQSHYCKSTIRCSIDWAIQFPCMLPLNRDTYNNKKKTTGKTVMILHLMFETQNPVDSIYWIIIRYNVLPSIHCCNRIPKSWKEILNLETNATVLYFTPNHISLKTYAYL